MQFDDKLAPRPAGSQDEFAASTYILAHLQDAGYTPLLDPVPVENLVRSTNVVAFPPRAEAPTFVVAIPYDTAPEFPSNGLALGEWLELARALYAHEPDHTVAFVALGAEHASVGGGDLGARRLAEYLIDKKLSPVVITLGSVSTEGVVFDASGSAAESLDAIARTATAEPARPPVDETSTAGDVFARAGFAQATVTGSVEGIGRVLLDALSDPALPSASPR